jgi:hypothetical protein
VEIGKSYNSDYSVRDPQKFDCIFWIIKIHSKNRLFSVLKNCYAKAYITTAGGQSTTHAVNLPWKNLRDPPTAFAPYTSLDIEANTREGFKKIFAYYYAEELRRNYASTHVDLRKGVTKGYF